MYKKIVFSKEEAGFMKEALDLAARGSNRVSPNPRVGCIIARSGKVIARGYHKEFGGPHAEINALDSSETSVSGATMYVSLEPCNHHGKTPPCSDKIIRSGIKKLIIAMKDPNLGSSSIDDIERAGIEVSCGLLEEEARELNRDYLRYIEKKRPYVTAKSAMSWDGKIATSKGESQWISGSASREFTMRLRAFSDAVLIGVTTANTDMPRLDYRSDEFDALNPKKVVVDPCLRINPDLAMLDTNCMIFTGPDADIKKLGFLNDKGCKLIQTDLAEGLIEPSQILSELYDYGVMSLLIEGGGSTMCRFFERSLVDRVIFIYGPRLIGGKASPTAFDGEGFVSLSSCPRLKNIKNTSFEDDVILQGDIH